MKTPLYSLKNKPNIGLVTIKIPESDFGISRTYSALLLNEK